MILKLNLLTIHWWRLLFLVGNSILSFLCFDLYRYSVILYSLSIRSICVFRFQWLSSWCGCVICLFVSVSCLKVLAFCFPIYHVFDKMPKRTIFFCMILAGRFNMFFDDFKSWTSIFLLFLIWIRPHDTFKGMLIIMVLIGNKYLALFWPHYQKERYWFSKLK